MDRFGEEATHYDVLGLLVDATRTEIRVAYKLLARTYHPDKNKSEDTTKKFQRILHAYEVLFCPDTRRVYDSELSADWLFRRRSAQSPQNQRSPEAASPNQSKSKDDDDHHAADRNPELIRACMNADVDEIERLIEVAGDIGIPVLNSALFFLVIGDHRRHNAAERRAFEMMPCLKALLDASADVNAASSSGTFILAAAARAGVVVAVCYLLERGAELNALSDVPASERQNVQGAGSLHEIHNGSMTALMCAAAKGHAHTVRILLDAAAYVDDRHHMDKTPLMLAATGLHDEAVEDLLSARANVSIQTKGGGTALLFAAAGGLEITGWDAYALKSHAALRRANVVKQLLEAKSCPREEFEDGTTPIWLASRLDDVTVAELLLASGADPQHRGPDGQSAIDAASSDEMKRLLSAEAAFSNDPEMCECGCFNGFVQSLPLYIKLIACFCSAKVPCYG